VVLLAALPAKQIRREKFEYIPAATTLAQRKEPELARRHFKSSNSFDFAGPDVVPLPWLFERIELPFRLVTGCGRIKQRSSLPTR
jgi:hypothetical protein